MSVLWLVILLVVFTAAAMAVAWQVVLRTGNSGFADVFWSYAVGIAGVTAALVPVTDTGPGWRNWLVAGLVALWSLRLGTHILGRTLKGSDDPRYAELKREWGANYPRQLLLFLEIQALVALLLALAVLAAASNPAPLGVFDLLGLAIAGAAIALEGLSDAQLAAFKADSGNRGKVCDKGLWSLSRHPNYVGEVLYWAALPVIGIGYVYGLFAVIAPAMMYWLLVHVSGIPPLEAHMLRSRPEAFADYQRRVNAFWPIPRTPRSIARQSP